MSKPKKQTNRTTSEWLAWATGEGCTDLVENAPNQEPVPGLFVSQHLWGLSILFCYAGKVYCSLCAMHLVCKGDNLKQHCLGYWYKKEFHETKHLQKVKKRGEIADAKTNLAAALRFHQFPRLSPVAIAYLLTPKSAARAERSFSLIGHIQESTHASPPSSIP